MINELLKYQEEDAKLRKILVELANTEAGKNMAQAKKYLETVEDSVKKAEAKAGELEASFNAIKDEIGKCNEQLNELTSALNTVEDENAVSFLTKKADGLFAKLKVLSSNAQRIEKEMKTAINEYANIISTTKTEQKRYLDNKEEYNKKKKEKEEEINAINANLVKLRKAVEPELMAKYDKKRKEIKFPIVHPVAVIGNDCFCKACSMQLPTSVIARLKAGEIIECDSCRHMIYLEK